MEIYRWLIIIIGLLVLGSAFFDIFSNEIEPKFLLLVAFTCLVASRIDIKFRKFNGTITVSDSFVFLALLLWGAPAAIISAAAESATCTFRLDSRLAKTYLFNIASMSIVTWCTAGVLKLFFGEITKISELQLSAFLLAIATMALTHYFGSLVITSVMQAFKLGSELWKSWAQYYLWACITFFVGAAIAGAIVKLLSSIGFVAVLLYSPIILLIYWAYQSYLKNLDALQESEARFRSSFDYAAIGMALVSREGRWIEVNPNLKEILRFSDEEFLSSFYQTMVDPADLPSVISGTQDLLDGKSPAFHSEMRFLNKSKEKVWVALGVSTASDLQGNLRHFIFQIQDITGRKLVEEKMMYDVLHDILTGLPNRASLLNNLQKALPLSSDRENEILAALFLDLDGFKVVNDSLGHSTGDELLKEVANRLLECVRDGDFVARLGGDEFTILLEKVRDLSQVTAIAERIKKRISEPVILNGQEVFVGTSIGIATTKIQYANPDEILRDADSAMYQSKARGKGCYTIFEPQMHDNAAQLLELTNDLRRAIEKGDFILHYQPIKSMVENRIIGFEALVRWKHWSNALISPAVFIPLAEEAGFINEIDNWTMNEACSQLRKWLDEFPEYKDLTISVNVSPKQFVRSGLVEKVKAAISASGLSAKNLKLEITESAVVQNIVNTAGMLQEITDFGVKIALDDFGTGYSSLSYLHELPITTLKIDRSFISCLSEQESRVEIVRAIVSLAHNLKMDVVAEGIETVEQLNKLNEMGCEFGQGYYLSRPLDKEGIHELLNFENASKSSIPTILDNEQSTLIH